MAKDVQFLKISQRNINKDIAVFWIKNRFIAENFYSPD